MAPAVILRTVALVVHCHDVGRYRFCHSLFSSLNSSEYD
jgi:hypothetical protein